jgi:hypothetical protein
MKHAEFFLKRQGLNPKLYRYIRQDAESYVFMYKPTGRIGAIRR